MSDTLLKHEDNDRILATKLVHLKNQMLEYDVGKAIESKFAGIKIGSKDMIPVSVSFLIKLMIWVIVQVP